MATLFASISTATIEHIKFVLNLLFLLATVGVFVGVWLENEKHSDRVKHRGWQLLVVCLAIEAIIGMALFQLDSEVSRRQSAEIASLLDRASAAEKAAAEANLALARIKNPRQLSPPQMGSFVEALRGNAGKGFWVQIQKGTASNFGEQIEFGRQLSTAFLSAGWKPNPRHDRFRPALEATEFSEVSDKGCQIAAAIGDRNLAQSVHDALRNASIECEVAEDASLISNFIIIEVGLR